MVEIAAQAINDYNCKEVFDRYELQSRIKNKDGKSPIPKLTERNPSVVSMLKYLISFKNKVSTNKLNSYFGYCLRDEKRTNVFNKKKNFNIQLNTNQMETDVGDNNATEFKFKNNFDFKFNNAHPKVNDNPFSDHSTILNESRIEQHNIDTITKRLNSTTFSSKCTSIKSSKSKGTYITTVTNSQSIFQFNKPGYQQRQYPQSENDNFNSKPKSLALNTSKSKSSYDKQISEPNSEKIRITKNAQAKNHERVDVRLTKFTKPLTNSTKNSMSNKAKMCSSKTVTTKQPTKVTGPRTQPLGAGNNANGIMLVAPGRVDDEARVDEIEHNDDRHTREDDRPEDEGAEDENGEEEEGQGQPPIPDNNINNQNSEVYQNTFDEENFDTLIRKHSEECANIVKNGKLQLILNTATVTQLGFDLGGVLNDNHKEALYQTLVRTLNLNQAPQRPSFFNITKKNDKWFITIMTNSKEQALDFIDPAKRRKLKGLGSINWFFPGRVSTKIMLNKLKRSDRINGWHLSRNGARIILELKQDTENESKFYTIKTPVEVAAMLTMSDDHTSLREMTKVNKAFYSKEGVFTRNEEALRLL